MPDPGFSEFVGSQNSFSGIDIKATFANRVVGEIQAISYTITREKAPIYTMGSADPRAFARGKRGIAGTLIFIVFDRHALLSELRGLEFFSDKDDVIPGYRSASAGQVVADAESDITSPASDQELAAPWYVDQIPSFDITLSAANEYGATAFMKIFGVEILNEGYGISIDDIVSEQQMTYIARAIQPWKLLTRPGLT